MNIKLHGSGLVQLLNLGGDHDGHAMISMITMLRYRFKEGKDTDLPTMLAVTSIFEASDPRDEIYSQFGMLNESEHDIIKPDYTAPVCELYTTVALRHLIDEHSLRILSFVEWDAPRNER